MKASFDGIRMRLVGDFNAAAQRAKQLHDPELARHMDAMRYSVVGLICMYSEEMDDCHDLSDILNVEEIDT